MLTSPDALRAHSGIIACASLYLRQALHQTLVNEEDPTLVDRCVLEGFAGDWDAFQEWATLYLREGCGIAG
jgi:hypothetical protein